MAYHSNQGYSEREKTSALNGLVDAAATAIPQDIFKKIYDYFDKIKSIGQLLLDAKVVTPWQLEEVIEKYLWLLKKRPKPLGMLLAEKGYLTYKDYLSVLSKHFNMPIISLENYWISSSLQNVLGDRYAHHHRIVMLENGDTGIRIALDEPTPHIMEELQKIFKGKKVEFYLASPHDIEYCFRRYFDPFSANNYQ